MPSRLGQCRDPTILRVEELLATVQARATVEDRYLDGQAALFPDVASGFEKQLRASQKLAVMATHLAELDGVEPPEHADPEVVTSRAGQLVADLVEPAKSEALDKLGEGRPAFDIANAGCGRSSPAPLPSPSPSHGISTCCDTLLTLARILDMAEHLADLHTARFRRRSWFRMSFARDHG